MNNEELNELLNEMDPEEKELTLAADDAYDRLYAYKLHKEYGVNVECNPGGDRTKVVIDGVTMDHNQFAAWLMSKQMAKMSQMLGEYSAGDAEDDEEEEEELPTEEIIDYEDLDGEIGSDRAVRNYLREKYDHYLAGGTQPTINWGYDSVEVTNIQWGRKR